MSLFYSMRKGVSGAIHYVVDQNRRLSLISRVRAILRQEERRANQAYQTLGRYYFEHLRDPENGETEFYCLEVEHANRRMHRARMKLDELTQQDSYGYEYDEWNEPDEDFEDCCMGCSDGCGCYEGMNPGTHWDDLARMHEMQKETARAQYLAEHPEDVDGGELEVELDEALKEYLNAKIRENQEQGESEPPLL